MIKIGKIWLEDIGDKTRANCKININNEEKVIWFEVDKKYGGYLCIERSDAYVIGLLNYALRNNEDIECETPVTEELLYNINTILIPSLVNYADSFKLIEVKAKTSPALEEGNAIGTGCSCGVDSFSTIYRHLNSKYNGLDITHLCLNNVGAFNDCYQDYGQEKVKEERYKITDNVAKELNLELIKTDSNFSTIILQDHLQTHTYSSIFAVYMLQKFWKKYYYASSGHDFDKFSLKNNDNNSSAMYELLSLQCFSTEHLRIYSDCGEMTRIEKLKSIVDFTVAQKYLHVCLRQPTNCTKYCSKCMRTLVGLDAFDKLDNFSEVFDIEYYKNNKNKYYKWLYGEHLKKDDLNESAYELLKNRKEFKKARVEYFIELPFIIIKKYLKKILKKVLPKKYIQKIKENKKNKKML